VIRCRTWSLAFLHQSAATAAKYDDKPRTRASTWSSRRSRRRRGCHLRRAELLRSGPARAADAPTAAGRDNVPYIRFKYAENSGQMQPIREQAGTFADSIKLWSEPMTQPPPPTVVKEPSMVKQKEMIAGNYDRLTGAKESGEKVVYTFVPGNLNELIMLLRRAATTCPRSTRSRTACARSGDYIMEAEKAGHSEDVCTYVKADIGMMAGQHRPTGKPLPKPDLLLLSYTGCFTFLKWFELLREEYKCPW
jgi:hypothetical protein